MTRLLSSNTLDAMVAINKESTSKDSSLVVSSLEPLRASDGVLRVSVSAKNQIKDPVTLKFFLGDSREQGRKALETSVKLDAEQSIEVSFDPSTAFASQDQGVFPGVEMSSDLRSGLDANAVLVETSVIKSKNPGSGFGGPVSYASDDTTVESVPMSAPTPLGPFI